MSTDIKELDYEKQRLAEVIGEIGKQLKKKKNSMDKHQAEGISIQKSLWEDIRIVHDLDDAANIWSYQVDLEKQANSYKNYASIVRKLERMIGKPYFGRIDFIEDGECKSEQLYIGIGSLVSEDSEEYLVYDWRAPVSSMFYDYEIGRAEYLSPSGSIPGDMLFKRQYKISNGSLEYILDSSIKIDDEILQEILAKSADSRMKTIVTTIQKEQNRIIRDEKNKLLLVQGPAGSGKTSIALHRIAFLLYRYRDTIKASNIAIFSPNDVFSDYISDVLPELGEENMYRTTFMDYVSNMLGEKSKAEDMYDTMEYILTAKNDKEYGVRIAGIKYKSSIAFLKLLEHYIKHLENTSFEFTDIIYRDNLIISREEINQLYLNDYNFLPVFKRLKKIRQRIYSLLEPYEKLRAKEFVEILKDYPEYIEEAEIKARSILMVREETSDLKNTINRITQYSVWDAYLDLIKNKELAADLSEIALPRDFDAIAQITINDINKRIIRYEDCAPILFLKSELGDKPDTSSIKHVIIDEVQDYNPVQYKIFSRLFENCSMTMLGDLNQSVNPYINIGSYDNALRIFYEKSPVLINLSKSYRSTYEITAFCRAISAQKEDAGYMERSGRKPQINVLHSKEDMYNTILNNLRSMEFMEFNSTAIVCRTAEESISIYEYMKDRIDIRMINHEDTEFATGNVIIPSYLSKGLEFDTVMVIGVGETDYYDEEERNLLYTVCTRALHRLNIYCVGKLFRFVDEVSRDLYEEIGR